MKNLSPIEWAWIAGIIEGEGCFSTTKTNPHPLFALQMVDEDIVARFADLVGVKYAHRVMKGEKHKDVFQIAVRRRSFIEWLIVNIYPWMGERRRSKIDECIAFYQSKGSDAFDTLLGTSA